MVTVPSGLMLHPDKKTASKPFHVLLLAGGSRGSSQEGDGEDYNNYLIRRNKFRKKANTSSNHKAEIADRGGEGVKDGMMPSLRSLSSQLEFAIAACCEGMPPDADDETNTASMNILRSGKEAHFLKLLLMYCPKHAVGHRALAVAVLQQTVDWETYTASNSKTKTAVKTELDADGTAGNEQHGLKIAGAASRDVRGKSHIQAKRTMVFLSAGGMKLMSRWLVESYTVVPAPSTSSNQRRPGEKLSAQLVASPTGCLLLPLLHLLKCIPFDKNIVVASQIHKSIKRLKKALDMLVKGLHPDILEKVVHPIAGGLSVSKVIAAVEGVMKCWGEAAVDATSSVITSSKVDPFHQLQNKIESRLDILAKFHNQEGDAPEWLPKSILGMWRAVPTSHIAKRNHPFDMPPVSSASSYKIASDVDCKNGKQGKFLESLREKMMRNKQSKQEPSSWKRKRVALAIEKSGKNAKQKVEFLSKGVSWADQKSCTNISPGPLREYKYFVKDEFILQEIIPSGGIEEEETYHMNDSNLVIDGKEFQESVASEGMKEEDDSDMEDLF